MNIIAAAVSSNLHMYANQEQASRQTGVAQDQAAERRADAKQAWKEQAQRVMAELQTSHANANKGENNLKVKALIDKFKLGKKLTPAEMAYLRKHAPDQIESIERISRERKAVEWGMRAAGTKLDVDRVILLTSRHALEKTASEEQIVRAAQFRDAHYEYMKTEEYRKKPDHPWDVSQDKAKSLRPLPVNQIKYTTMALFAYEKAKRGSSIDTHT